MYKLSNVIWRIMLQKMKVGGPKYRQQRDKKIGGSPQKRHKQRWRDTIVVRASRLKMMMMIGGG